MDTQKLKATAQAMVAPGKGVLAIDESHKTCQKRFDALGVEFSEDTRRAYRGLLITAPGIEEYISGIILYDETLRQSTEDGTPFPKELKDKGVIPGIKVDTGAKDLALHPGEKVTEGLDGLRERLAEYKELGAEFAKWRAVITIGENMPSRACIEANAHALARYAALCQEADFVPMVEPEVLIDGDHSIEKCYEVTAETLKTLFEELKEQGVMLEGTILKTSMVITGKGAEVQASVEEVAEMTVKCLKENVPAELAGIVFLSGGQTEQQATKNLDAMNRNGDLPWPLSFSYGRAIQGPALKLWADNQTDIDRAQRALVHRSKCNALATQGQYTEEVEHENV